MIEPPLEHLRNALAITAQPVENLDQADAALDAIRNRTANALATLAPLLTAGLRTVE